MAERRIGVACATRLPGLSHEAAAQGRRAPASLERRTRQATGEEKRAGTVDRLRHASLNASPTVRASAPDTTWKITFLQCEDAEASTVRTKTVSKVEFAIQASATYADAKWEKWGAWIAHFQRPHR